MCREIWIKNIIWIILGNWYKFEALLNQIWMGPRWTQSSYVHVFLHFRLPQGSIEISVKIASFQFIQEMDFFELKLGNFKNWNWNYPANAGNTVIKLLFPTSSVKNFSRKSSPNCPSASRLLRFFDGPPWFCVYLGPVYPKNHTWAISGVFDFPLYIDSARFLYSMTIFEFDLKKIINKLLKRRI